MRTLAESPTGLVHAVTLLENGRGHTRCGREVNWDTWGRISSLDQWIFGKTPTTVRERLELPVCEKCFS